MDNFAAERCVPCRADEPPLDAETVREYAAELPDWESVDVRGVRRLRRRFRFPDFAQALAFTDSVGALAEEQDHHPRLVTQWGRVTVDWWTHAIDGLHRNDFIMAAKTDELYADEFEA